MSETILRGSLQSGNERLRGTIRGSDALNGSLQNEDKEIKGALLNPEKIYGKSAYEIALMHGFEGTEEEWLESLSINGLTPYIKDGYWYIGDENTNVKAVGVDGKDGYVGADGYTPIKGKDYFTEKDKDELVEELLNRLPYAEEVSV